MRTNAVTLPKQSQYMPRSLQLQQQKSESVFSSVMDSENPAVSQMNKKRSEFKFGSQNSIKPFNSSKIFTKFQAFQEELKKPQLDVISTDSLDKDCQNVSAYETDMANAIRTILRESSKQVNEAPGEQGPQRFQKNKIFNFNEDMNQEKVPCNRYSIRALQFKKKHNETTLNDYIQKYGENFLMKHLKSCLSRKDRISKPQQQQYTVSPKKVVIKKRDISIRRITEISNQNDNDREELEEVNWCQGCFKRMKEKLKTMKIFSQLNKKVEELKQQLLNTSTQLIYLKSEFIKMIENLTKLLPESSPIKAVALPQFSFLSSINKIEFPKYHDEISVCNNTTERNMKNSLISLSDRSAGKIKKNIHSSNEKSFSSSRSLFKYRQFSQQRSQGGTPYKLDKNGETVHWAKDPVRGASFFSDKSRQKQKLLAALNQVDNQGPQGWKKKQLKTCMLSMHDALAQLNNLCSN